MGRWHQIASIPAAFEPKNGGNTRATYNLNKDGSVKVLTETRTDDKRGSTEGIAYKVDPKSDEAKLLVKFHPRSTFVAHHSSCGYGAVSKNSHVAEVVYNQMVRKAKGVGYDVSKLQKTPHSEEAPPRSEDGPKDTNGAWWIKSILGNC